jgi:hypothetical protein
MKQLLTFLLVLSISITQAQTIVSMSPNSGAAGSTVNVTITGNGTSFTNNTIFVLAQGTSVLQLTNIAASNATTITATLTIPSTATSGAYTLTLAGLPPKQLTNAFTVTGGGSTASIVSITPDQGSQGDFVSITINTTGTHYANSFDITGSLLKVGSQPISFDFVSPIDDTTLFVFVSLPADASLGNYSLVLASLSNGSLTKANAFTIIENPNGSLLGMTPDVGGKGDSLSVIISGKATRFTDFGDVSAVLFSNQGTTITLTNLNIINDSTIEAEMIIPKSARAGTCTLFLSLDTISMFKADVFTIESDGSPEPTLVSINPSTGYAGQTLNITAKSSGTFFMDSAGMSIALFSNDTFVEANSFYVVNDSVIVANFTIPANFEVGLILDFGVSTDVDGFMQLPEAFEVIAHNTALNEVTKMKVNVFPNPASDELWFVIPAQVNKAYLMDMVGRMSEVTIDNINGDKHRIDLVDKSPGVYSLILETDQGIHKQQFIIR